MNSEMVKQGYKHTEVGLIPEEWSVHRLENILARLKNGAVYTATKNGGVPISRIETISSGKIDFEKVGFAEHSKQLEQYQLQPKDMLFSHINSLDHIGKIAIYNGPDPLFHGMNLLLLRAAEGVIPNFLFHWFDSPIGRQRTIVLAKQAVSQASISTSDLRVLPIPLPPKQEQSRIADVIDEADCLINKLDQLIAKKRDIKQATMQQLLTGQTRLPGFSGEWELKRLGSLGTTYGGLTGKTKDDFGHGDARYIPFMNVMTDTVIDPDWLERVDVDPGEAQNIAKKGDLFFNGSSETPEEVGYCSVLLEDIPNLYLNSFCFGFRFNPESMVDGLFFAYWFRCEQGRKAMSVLAQGATRYNISKSAFLELKIPQPSADEQAAIATALSDLDAELAALEVRRDKTRAIKQGMMQELLTGRIRLA